jgi:uncharacterized linocin/CFP29 family protein
MPDTAIYKEFVIGARNLAASRRMGHPLDTTHVAISTRLVSEAAENLLFNADPGCRGDTLPSSGGAA